MDVIRVAAYDCSLCNAGCRTCLRYQYCSVRRSFANEQGCASWQPLPGTEDTAYLTCPMEEFDAEGVNSQCAGCRHAKAAVRYEYLED